MLSLSLSLSHTHTGSNSLSLRVCVSVRHVESEYVCGSIGQRFLFGRRGGVFQIRMVLRPSMPWLSFICLLFFFFFFVFFRFYFVRLLVVLGVLASDYFEEDLSGSRELAL